MGNLLLEQASTRLKTETDESGRLKTPFEIYQHLGDISFMRPEFIEAVDKRFNEKKAELEKLLKRSRPKTIYTGNNIVHNIKFSPDEKFITYNIFQPPYIVKKTFIPNYITESGYTEIIPSREKAGSQQGIDKMYIYDIINDTVYQVDNKSIPGIKDQPDYVKDYKNRTKKAFDRKVIIYGPYWSNDGQNAFINIISEDNKDR